MNLKFDKVVIVGVGLIGGSLGMVLRKERIAGEIVGVGRSVENMRLARRMGIIDSFTDDPAIACEGADLLVVATPVNSIAELVARSQAGLKSGAIVTDVGSVKQMIVREVERIIRKDLHFVGAHPIAGTEQKGARAAFAGLFQGRRCVLTPTKKSSKWAVARIREMWKRAGMTVTEMDPGLHDRILAATSHTPHMVAFALAGALGEMEEKGQNVVPYLGSGFKDTTRIASSPPEMWRDICLMNRDSLLGSIRSFERSLGKLKRAIGSSDGDRIIRELEKSKVFRDRVKA